MWSNSNEMLSESYLVLCCAEENASKNDKQQPVAVVELTISFTQAHANQQATSASSLVNQGHDFLQDTEPSE